MKLIGWIVVALCLSNVAFAQDGRATAHIFPQLADGRFSDGTYYRSALQISNPSSTASGSCAVAFRGMTTTLEDVAGGVLTAGAFSLTLPGNSWGVFRTPGTAAFQAGYATVTCTIPVNAVLIYSFYSANSTKLSEAAVFSSPPSTFLQVISDQRDGARLGIAITNDTDSAAVTTINASNTLGQSVGNTTITIPGRSQSVKFLDELLPGLPREHVGQVLVRSFGPQLAMIGLRYTGAAFTTIPSTVRQATTLDPPTISSITPSSGAAGTTVTVAIAGTNFVSGATTVSLTGSGITVSGTQVISATSVSAVFALSSSAALGTRSVTVTTAGGTSSAMNFSVSAAGTAKPFNQTQTERMIGTWLLSYSIGSSPFSQTYRLSNVQPDTTSPGEWVISGTDQFGELVIAFYSTSLKMFALLDTATPYDRFYVYDFTGTNTVGGCYYQAPTGTTNLSPCYSMNGAKTSASTLTEALTASNVDRQATGEVDEGYRAGAASDAPSSAIIELLDKLRAYRKLSSGR